MQTPKATIEQWQIGDRRYLEISRREKQGEDIGFASWVTPAIGGVDRLPQGMTATVTGEGL